jgi:hypothetical protein
VFPGILFLSDVHMEELIVTLNSMEIAFRPSRLLCPFFVAFIFALICSSTADRRLSIPPMARLTKGDLGSKGGTLARCAIRIGSGRWRN